MRPVFLLALLAVAVADDIPTNENYCPCENPDKIWLDIVFVVDVSSDMTSTGVENVIALVASTLYPLTFGNGTFQSRVGIVSYSKDSQIVYDLDVIQSGDDVDALNIPYIGDDGNNIKSGIEKASEMLDNIIPGRNARKVIVVIASAYKNGDTDDPNQLSDQFKNSGGNIITLEYIQPGDDEIPLLKEIASQGFSFTNVDQQFSGDNFIAAFCQANCFCQQRLLSFSRNAQLTPDGGCIEYVNLPAVFRAARSSCTRKNAKLVSVHDDTKQNFVTTATDTLRDILWIGLSRTGGEYKWEDGQPLDNNYQHWADNQPDTSTGKDCVYTQQYSGFNTGWFTDKCTTSHHYLCESKPCSTEYYCF